MLLIDSRIKDEFDVEPISSTAMDKYIKRCMDIYSGMPDWVDPDGHIKTVNVAKSVCSEVARLTTLAIGIKIDGSARAKWLQEQIDAAYSSFRDWTEYGCAAGNMILKPNGEGIDFVMPDRYKIVDMTNGAITGIVFIDRQKYDKKWYTRLEYHRFTGTGENRRYEISNRCFKGESENDNGRAVPIAETPWSGLQEDIVAVNVDKPLFGVFRTPSANNVDIGSPLGLPVFAEAIEELRDFDIAYSRNAKEILDSKRLVLLDSDRLLSTPGARLSQKNADALSRDMGLPDYIKTVEGDGNSEIYHEINPSLNTEMRKSGMDFLLSQIGYKCGFSNGYFVFNEKSGMVTATQVESDDRRTIHLIKDMRDKLQACLDSVIYALDKFADAYNLAPAGTYKVTYDFGDITYNREEDRARWYSYAQSNKIPFWYYLVKFEGLSEEEAKALIEEATPADPMFGGEE